MAMHSEWQISKRRIQLITHCAEQKVNENDLIYTTTAGYLAPCLQSPTKRNAQFWCSAKVCWTFKLLQVLQQARKTLYCQIKLDFTNYLTFELCYEGK